MDQVLVWFVTGISALVGFEAFLFFKYRHLLALLLKHWWYKRSGAKFAVVLRPDDKFATFEIWTPDKKGTVKRGKTVVSILPDSVFYNPVVNGQMIIHKAGDMYTYSLSGKNIVNAEKIEDALMRAEREGALTQEKDTRIILLLLVGALLLAGVAAFFSFTNADMLNKLSQVVVAALKSQAAKQVAQNVTKIA